MTRISRVASWKIEDKHMFKCDNCGSKYKTEGDMLRPKDLDKRVSPGELCPAGECPKCGALCHEAGRIVLSPERAQDLLGVVGYLLEYEYEPFIQYLQDNPGLTSLTDDELAALENGDDNDQHDAALAKAVTEDNHAYALAERLHEALAPHEDDLYAEYGHDAGTLPEILVAEITEYVNRLAENKDLKRAVNCTINSRNAILTLLSDRVYEICMTKAACVDRPEVNEWLEVLGEVPTNSVPAAYPPVVRQLARDLLEQMKE